MGDPITPAGTNDPQGGVFELVSDTQFPVWVYSRGVGQSAAVQRRAPGLRSPGQNLAVGHVTETLMGHAARQVDRIAPLQGTIFGGDADDLAAYESMEKQFRYWMDRAARGDQRHALRLFEIGNHDCLNKGTGRSGWDGLGLMGLVLNLQGRRSLAQDIHIPEVGEPSNVLDKWKTIVVAFETAGWQAPEPVVIRESSRWNFRLDDLRKGDWDNDRDVVGTFWKTERDGSEHAVVKFRDRPGGKNYAEKHYIYTSALKMDDLTTANGQVPVYYIALDTMDFTDRRDEPEALRGFQNLQGQVSATQVRLLEAYIAAKKRENPRAVFVLGGHYAVTQMRGMRSSGLYRVLSDPAVIAYVASHSHKRDMIDLNGMELEEGGRVERKTPLVQYKVPSVIDAPNEMSLLHYGVDPHDRSKIFIELRYVGVDEANVPGNSEEVREALLATVPDVLTYDDAIEHVRHPLLREAATPGTTEDRYFEIAANIDKGLLSAPGAIHDEIVAQDTLPTHIEDVQAVFRILARTTKLLMVEGDEAPMGVDFERAMLARVGLLDDRYEEILRGQYGRQAELDEHSEPFDLELYAMGDSLHSLTTRQDDPRKKELLGRALAIVKAMHSYVYAYENWIDDYEQTLKMNRPNSTEELINEATLFGNRHFRTLLYAVRDIPQGSYAQAYLVHVLLESARQSKEFYADPDDPPKEEPDVVRISYRPSDRHIDVWKSPLPNPKREPWCGECRELGHRTATEAQARVRAQIPPRNPNEIEGHWTFRLGNHMRGGTNFGPSLRLGHDLHLYNPPFEATVPVRLNVGLRAGADFIDWTNRFDERGVRRTTYAVDLPAEFELTLGDPLGFLEFGAAIGVGLTRRDIGSPEGSSSDRFTDIHGVFKIAEGLVYFEVNGHRYFRKKRPVAYTTAGVDVLGILRRFNWIDREY